MVLLEQLSRLIHRDGVEELLQEHAEVVSDNPR
jgi:hypothetical protein